MVQTATHARHWHGYLWIGSAADLKNDAHRRAGTGGLPPLQTGYYLKHGRAAKTRTWTDVDQVLAWMRDAYETNPPHSADNHLPVERHIVFTREGLTNGADGWWQYYTPTGVCVIATICCPHTHLPQLGCPAPPDCSKGNPRPCP